MHAKEFLTFSYPFMIRTGLPTCCVFDCIVCYCVAEVLILTPCTVLS